MNILACSVFLSMLGAVLCSCRNPPGNDCNWYRNCLEASHRCGSSGYALKYADNFCKRYDSNLNGFSAYGKRWVGAVKRCLQQKLAPLLSRSVSCSYIKQFAFESHVPCYTNPAPGLSFCSLPLLDYYDVIKTIKGAVLSEFKATVGGGWDTLISCFNRGRKR